MDERGGEKGDHLAVAIVGLLELAPHFLERRGGTQSLKGAPLRRTPGLRASTFTYAKDRRSSRPAKAEAMLGDDAPMRANDNRIGIGLDLDRPANGTGADRVFVVVEPHQAVLRHSGVESIEAAAIGDKFDLVAGT